MLKNQLIYKYWLMKQINHPDLNSKLLRLLYELIRPKFYTIPKKSKINPKIEDNKFVYYTDEGVRYVSQVDKKQALANKFAKIDSIDFINLSIKIIYENSTYQYLNITFNLDIDNSLLPGIEFLFNWSDNNNFNIAVSKSKYIYESF